MERTITTQIKSMTVEITADYCEAYHAPFDYDSEPERPTFVLIDYTVLDDTEGEEWALDEDDLREAFIEEVEG